MNATPNFYDVVRHVIFIGLQNILPFLVLYGEIFLIACDVP